MKKIGIRLFFLLFSGTVLAQDGFFTGLGGMTAGKPF